ncbi:MAG: DUF3301 domain-containing protein [Alishewanella agri]|nr:DUF3301 domain-containing protein [Alishewanella agri]
MASIVLLLLVITIGYGFWLQRKQDERAVLLARQLCRQHQLQYLECGRSHYRLRKIGQRRLFVSCYQVDFSADGESRYQAELVLSGLHLAAFELPPHRIPS